MQGKPGVAILPVHLQHAAHEVLGMTAHAGPRRRVQVQVWGRQQGGAFHSLTPICSQCYFQASSSRLVWSAAVGLTSLAIQRAPKQRLAAMLTRMQHHVEHLFLRLPEEGQQAREQGVQADAQRPDVGGRAVVAPQHLRRLRAQGTMQVGC